MRLIKLTQLDGGGVKGYSSLLILKRLISLIEELECGQRRYNDVSDIKLRDAIWRTT
jgi:hypothetical protein